MQASVTSPGFKSNPLATAAGVAVLSPNNGAVWSPSSSMVPVENSLSALVNSALKAASEVCRTNTDTSAKATAAASSWRLRAMVAVVRDMG